MISPPTDEETVLVRAVEAVREVTGMRKPWKNTRGLQMILWLIWRSYPCYDIRPDMKRIETAIYRSR